MIFKAKNKSGQWEYSDPIQHQFAWECEFLYGFDMARLDTFIDDIENNLNESSNELLQAKRSLAFEAYQQNNMGLLKDRLDYLILAVNHINQGRAFSELSELMKAGFVKTIPQVVTTPIAKNDEAKNKTSKPIPQQRFQENEILRVIADLGFNPKKIPKWVNGKRGLKADVRDILVSNTFTQGVFESAWERLRASKDIQDA